MSNTPIADMVEAMLAAGTPTAAILLLIRTIETVTLASRHASRDGRDALDKAAQRSRRYRARKSGTNGNAEANDAAHTVTLSSRDASRDDRDASCNLLTSFSESQSGIREVSKKDTASVVEGQKVSRGTRLEAGSPLSEENLKFALDAGMTAERAKQAWAEFHDYWIAVPGSRGRKINWPATWRNRVRAIGGNNGAGNGFRGSRTLQDDSRSVSRALDRLGEGLKAGTVKFAPRPRLVRDESEGDLRLLPKG